MEMRIDAAGRIVVPKALRQRMGLETDIVLEAIRAGGWNSAEAGRATAFHAPGRRALGSSGQS